MVEKIMEFLLCTKKHLFMICSLVVVEEYFNTVFSFFLLCITFSFQRCEFTSSIFLPSKIHVVLDNRLAVASSFQEAAVNY